MNKTIYQITSTSRYRKDYKNLIKQGKDINRLDEVIKDLAQGKTLPEKYHDHKLTGQWQGYHECYIQPDWLLVYEIRKNTLIFSIDSRNQ